MLCLICFLLKHVCSFDLLEICTSGPKEKLDSTVLSQVSILLRYVLLSMFL